MESPGTDWNIPMHLEALGCERQTVANHQLLWLSSSFLSYLFLLLAATAVFVVFFLYFFFELYISAVVDSGILTRKCPFVCVVAIFTRELHTSLFDRLVPLQFLAT